MQRENPHAFEWHVRGCLLVYICIVVTSVSLYECFPHFFWTLFELLGHSTLHLPLAGWIFFFLPLLTTSQTAPCDWSSLLHSTGRNDRVELRSRDQRCGILRSQSSLFNLPYTHSLSFSRFHSCCGLSNGFILLSKISCMIACLVYTFTKQLVQAINPNKYE